MNLNHLQRNDLHKIGATNRNCAKIFPLSKKKFQKIIVGDYEGIVHCFSIKKGSVQQSFKTLPQKNAVRSIEMFKDKAFAAIGGMIKGYSRKGKEFFKMQTSMTTEDVNSMCIEVPNIWVAGEYIVHHYQENIEKGFYISPDKVNCLLTHNITSLGEYDTVLGCQDKVLRVIKDSKCNLEVVVGSPVQCMARYKGVPGDEQEPKEDTQNLIYGTSNGSVGFMRFGAKKSVTKAWDVNGKNGVQVISKCDFTKDGVEDILVGREDGNVEIYSFDVSPIPNKVFERNVNESVTCIQTGYLTNFGQEDMLVCTFSGKILTYSPPNLSAQPVPERNIVISAIKEAIDEVSGGNAPKVVGVSNEFKVVNLRKEIAKLEEQAKQVKDRYANMSEEMIAVSCKYNINQNFALDTDNAYYRLSIELDIPIDMIALRSNTQLDLLDSETQNVIVSNCQSEPRKDYSQFKAIFRCGESLKRLDITMRTIEGQYGELEAFVIPKLTPKTSQVVTYSIKPLSLHERVYQIPDLDKSLYNTLTMTGAFSFAQMHGWIGLCFEGIPEKTYEEELNYCFRSTFLGTYVIIKSKKGEATFQSDNATALAVLQEIISKQATEQKIKISMTYTINDESFATVLKTLYPKLEYQLSLTQKMEILDALKEIQLQEENIDFMPEDYQQTLNNSKELQQAFAQQPRRLEFLFGIVLRLYEDKYRFKRQNPQQKVAELQQRLKERNFNLNSLITLFKEN